MFNDAVDECSGQSHEQARDEHAVLCRYSPK